MAGETQAIGMSNGLLSIIIYGVLAIVGLAVGLVVYFIPAIIGFKRDHANKVAILMLDIFLGWTFVGWVIALVWAFTKNTNENKQ